MHSRWLAALLRSFLACIVGLGVSSANGAVWEADIELLRQDGPGCTGVAGTRSKGSLIDLGRQQAGSRLIVESSDEAWFLLPGGAATPSGRGARLLEPTVAALPGEDLADRLVVEFLAPDCLVVAALTRRDRQAESKFSGAGHRVAAHESLALGSSLLAGGRSSEARVEAERAAALMGSAYGPRHVSTRRAIRVAAMAQAWQGEVKAALDRLSTACPIFDGAAAMAPEDVPCLIDALEPLLWASRLRDADLLSARLAALPQDRIAATDRIRTRLWRAEVMRQTSRIPQARTLVEEAVADAEAWLPDGHALRALARGALARVYLTRGTPEVLAAAALSTKLHEAAFGTAHVRTGQALALQGVANMEHGRLVESLRLLEKALGVVSDAVGPDHVVSVGVLFNLAGPYLLLGRDEDGLEIYRRVEAAIRRDFGAEHSLRLVALRNIGVALRRLDRPSEALAADLELIDAARAALGPRHEATLAALRSLSTDYFVLGRMEEALAVNREALDLHIAVYGLNHSYTLHQRSQYARILRGMKRYDEAVAEAESVLRDVERIQGEYHHEAFGVMGNLADSYEAAGRMSDARALNERFVARFERLRDNAALAVEWRQSYFASVSHVYQNLARYYVAEGRDEDAFRIAELTKARTLLESLLTKRAEDAGVLPAAEAEQLATRERAIADLTGRIGAAGSPQERARLEAERNLVALDLSNHRSRLREQFPRYAQLTQVVVPSAAQSRRLVHAGAVLVNYALADRKLIAFVVTRSTLRAYDLGNRERLDETVHAYRHLLERRGPERVWRTGDGFVVSAQRPRSGDAEPATLDGVAALLASQLLAPMAPVLSQYRSWVISPAGALAVVPFEALPFGGAPVISARQVSYVQSASVLALMRQRQASLAEPRLFAMGAPAYPSATDQRPGNPLRATAAATSAAMKGGDESALRRGFDTLGLAWEPLPGAGAEVRTIGRLFPATGSTVFLGEDASEDRLNRMNQQGSLARYRYIHFATHAYLSTAVPALSSIVLAQQGNPPAVDGYVTAAEWLKFRLDSELIVLSACQTALGQQVDGEGVMGLPYALFVAGNRRTLLSLWPVRDDVTGRFMVRFYSLLLAGQTPSAALAAVKNEFRQSTRDADPLHWAGFVLYGTEAGPGTWKTSRH